MAKFVKGDVVVISFFFSDLSQSKRRPALVLTTLDGDDAILCQITSKNISDKYAVLIDDTDFRSGHLKQSSNIRPNRLLSLNGMHAGFTSSDPDDLLNSDTVIPEMQN